MEIEPTKTKVVEFGRDAEAHARARREQPQTFDFLGFTHYCGRTKDGKRFRMKRVTSRKKFRAKRAAFKEWLKKSRVMPTSWIMEKVALKLRGHYAYYGVTDNYRGIARFHREVTTNAGWRLLGVAIMAEREIYTAFVEWIERAGFEVSVNEVKPPGERASMSNVN